MQTTFTLEEALILVVLIRDLAARVGDDPIRILCNKALAGDLKALEKLTNP